MLIHQNRVSHTPKNAISERYLPSWLDLVVWGHEHECLVEPTDFGDFHVSQPGSSVATSLIEGEAKQKKIMLLEVRSDPEAPNEAPFWRATPIRARDPERPFKYTHVSLIDARAPARGRGGLGKLDRSRAAADLKAPPNAEPAAPSAAAHEAWTRDVLEETSRAMIDDALAPFRAASRAAGRLETTTRFAAAHSTCAWTTRAASPPSTRRGSGRGSSGRWPTRTTRAVSQARRRAARRSRGRRRAPPRARAAAAEDEEPIGGPLMAGPETHRDAGQP